MFSSFSFSSSFPSFFPSYFSFLFDQIIDCRPQGHVKGQGKKKLSESKYQQKKMIHSGRDAKLSLSESCV